MSTSKDLGQLAAALRAGGRLDDAQVAKLANLRRGENVFKRHVVAVEKLEMRDGEDLWDFMDAMWTAVQTNRVLLADGSLDAWLEGIYDDFVIVQDGNTGRLFKAAFTRDLDGEFEFGDPVEVVATFTEVAPEGGAVGLGVAKRAPDRVLSVDLRKRRRWAFLPTSIRVGGAR